MTSKIETTNELRDDKVLRLVIKYSIPAILAMMVTSLYNTVDRAFIGSMKDVGALAISGLGVTMPFMTILGAFCVGLAVGGSTNIAIKLGEGNKEEAEAIETAVSELDEDLEIEIHEGNQPVYPYLISVE